MSLTQDIKEHAHSLGFSLVGVTTPDPTPHVDVFEGWLSQGRHGEMGYLATPRSRTCRAHSELLLPGCRSVIALGVRYPSPQPEPAGEMGLRGRVAAYAWGEDYHLVFPERLKQLVLFIEAQVGHAVPHRWYTDSGPLLERELAQRAGLGWIGKNTCLIDPRRGSYFLLAEVLLGIELEPDTPFIADRCGSCTRCIAACPTQCILPDRTLDAGRCISYLTIELKGAIPPELRPRMGNWVFGCDACQEACPWNRFAVPEGEAAFAHRLVDPYPDLLEEMSLQPLDFNRKYRHSPFRRAKRRGYLRNVAVALGNSQDMRAVPALAEALLSDPEPLVRGHAAWALGQIGGPAARLALERAAGNENDPAVQAEIQDALDG
ncbi:MAG: tRNA epoxyqueuosine(34) reductase QueG [Chloroflexi bacterium RBG_16_54_11]|nr:MAG: tRNA epoxyqueuosine(34) reductase QueG [Chloroflexi bacterium RBG_16_54_11]